MALTSLIPDGVIILCKGVPLTNEYRDTYSFTSTADQFAFFAGKQKMRFGSCAPVDIGKSIRIATNANNLYDCSYMCFQNSNYSQKWFYAFVTNVSWLSVNDCIVEYEVDDFQSWYFEAVYPPCFVEREHVDKDAVGDNLIPENLELGEYEMIETLKTGFFQDYSLIAAASFNKQGSPSVGGYYSGLYNGLELNVFTDASSLNSFLTTMTAQNKSSGIVSVFMFPSDFIDTKGSDSAKFKQFACPKKQDGELNGYVPRNNKLYTYPYNLLFCTNLSGSSAEFRYEDFSTPSCTFWVYMDMSCNPTAILAPYAYAGVQEDGVNWNEKITMDGFPQCSWTTDTFRAWLAQNGSSTAIGGMSSALSGIGSLFTGNIGGFLSSATSIAQTVAQVHATSTLPNQAHGPTAGSALVASQHKDFYFYRMTLKPEFLRVIDDYFDMFGYAVHELKQPNMTGRPSWNYVKTQECKVLGSLPSPAARHIESMLNNGIRLWHGDWMGQYFRSNKLEVDTDAD